MDNIESYERRNDENLHGKDDDLQMAQVKTVKIKKEIRTLK